MHRCLAPTALLIASCASTPSGEPLGVLTPEINATRTTPDDRIHPGDTISIEFVHVDDPWDQDPVSVLESGLATFIGVDTLMVAGMTLDELDTELTRLYAPMVKPSDLSVSIVSKATRAVFVMGEVQAPGRFEFQEGVTLIEALTLAGGPVRDTARLDQVLLIRLDPDDGKQRHWKIDASIKYWTGIEPLHLQNRDVVFIPATAATKVNDWVDRYIRRNIPLPSLFGPAY